MERHGNGRKLVASTDWKSQQASLVLMSKGSGSTCIQPMSFSKEVKHFHTQAPFFEISCSSIIACIRIYCQVSCATKLIRPYRVWHNTVYSIRWLETVHPHVHSGSFLFPLQVKGNWDVAFMCWNMWMMLESCLFSSSHHFLPHSSSVSACVSPCRPGYWPAVNFSLHPQLWLLHLLGVLSSKWL